MAVSPTPGPYIKNAIDAAQFYTNKVLVAYKEHNPVHVDWAKSWISFLTELQNYVRKQHTTGLVWNPRGGDALSGQTSGPLPPPPPPPAGFFDEPQKPKEKSRDDNLSALFASINCGSNITGGLRKIDPNQMTHKNPSLRQSSVVPDKQSNGSPAVKKIAPKAPPKLELVGKKWVVENHTGNQTLKVSDTNMSQCVDVYNCNDSLLVVEGKVTSITVNKCKKFSIVFDDVVAVVEFIDSQRIKTQVNGKVSTITVDKVDGIEIYLDKLSLNCEIVSSKSSEINVSVKDSSDEYVSFCSVLFAFSHHFFRWNIQFLSNSSQSGTEKVSPLKPWTRIETIFPNQIFICFYIASSEFHLS